ncbi:membrane-associated proteins in eicosanoid and glutathione metabolism [Mytilinidion resinicola]|uniref:Membrane-associated proteins in eicosanoid and glutathione metabolism n=1 Tax=Mytilinidion resinicola TaxID=574789 RepID=A0A6A6Y551_9PEZI|nr:membrane-associated proteins in eicosanoid and glutathione metabolism [Mytilinidion resinicola]KAF2803971.1 membrane-associated proteins in eicosanoid and glutathione metabolism [Mytilinidion resinicola]
MATIEVPREYGYVVLTAISTVFLGVWHGLRVGTYRKAASIPYPYEYASYEQVSTAPPAKQHAMYLFNCAQRAHQNYNENHPSALAMILIAGIRYPLSTTALGVIWAVNRTIYAVGYTNAEEQGARKGGKGRYRGVGWYVGHIGLAGLCIKTGIDMVLS